VIIGTAIELQSIRIFDEEVQSGLTQERKAAFTLGELTYCFDQRAVGQHLAARYAAKRAAFTALGLPQSGAEALAGVEILRKKSGQPFLRLHGPLKEHASKIGLLAIHISLSHAGELAVAMVLAEGAESTESGRHSS